MKKIYTLLFAGFLIGNYIVKAQSISYDYVRNDPFDIKNLTFAIDPFFVDVNGHNSYSFGWGIRAEHMMGKRLLANFDARFGFGTNLYRKSNDNTRNYFNMEGGLGLIFVNRVKTKNVPIILSSSTSGNIKTTLSIKGGVPAKCRLIVALRGGFSQYTNTLDYKNLTDTLLTVNGVPYKTAKDSYIFKDSSGAAVANIPQVGGISILSVYGGLQFRSIRNLIIDVAGYGQRGNIVYSDFYVDVLFAPLVGIKDFKNTDGTRYDVKYDEISRLGWRLGWFWRKPKDQGFSWKFEFGSRPGFKAPKNVSVPVNKKNLYAMVTFGLYIPLKIKPVYDGE
jgi:hypothetical protein